MKILHVEPARYPASLRARLSELGDVDYCEVASQSEFDAKIAEGGWNCIFLRLGVALTRSHIASLADLSFVVTPTTGHAHIDTEAMTDHQIPLISLKGERTFLRRIRSTAEHTIGLMLAIMRQTSDAHRDVVAGNWRREPFLGEELFEKTIGIVGLGRLGSLVAEVCVAFGMRVLFVDTRADVSVRSAERTDIDTLLATSDVISLHLPLEDETRTYLSKERIERMKTTAFVVNTARGELVDEEAILTALRQDRLAGYATDVIDGDSSWSEKSPAGHPLVEHAKADRRLLITPHIGGYGRSSIEGTRAFVVEKLHQAIHPIQKEENNERKTSTYR